MIEKEVDCLRVKRLYLILLCLCSLLLSGCMIKSVSELYALPDQSAEFRALQSSVREIVTGGVQYSSPVYGSNQQPIQMADFDGDGVDEAIVFTTSGSGEFPLKAYVFDKSGDEFINICAIEGAGYAFDRVEYAQLDGKGGSEIIIGRQVGDQTLQTVGVYSIEDGRPVEHFSANYSEFTITDLDGDGNRDVFLLRFNADTRAGIAELFRCKLWNGKPAFRFPSIRRNCGESIREGFPKHSAAYLSAV